MGGRTLLRRGRRGPTGTPKPPAEVVVFSGGGSLGAAQVGAVQALFEAGIVPDAVVGCSVGAINAAYIAIDPSAQRAIALEKVWRGITRDQVFADGRFAVARRLAARAQYLYRPDGLREIFTRTLSVTDLSETAIPCHIVTTDLIAGTATWWTAGNAVDILAASSCLPGLFPPVELDGRLYVDGGVSCPVPTQRALDLGAIRVWVLNVSRDFHGWADARMSAVDVLLESFAISRSHLGRIAPAADARQQVISLPRLPVGRHDLRDFSKTPQLIAAGREAGRAMVMDALRPHPPRASELGDAQPVTPTVPATS